MTEILEEAVQMAVTRTMIPILEHLMARKSPSLI